MTAEMPNLKQTPDLDPELWPVKKKTSDETDVEFETPERPDIKTLDTAVIDRVIEMAWEDRTTFDVIEQQFGLKEQDVIEIMRRYMKRSSFKMWRKRVTERQTKHAKKRAFEVGRFKSSNQKNY